MAMRLLQSLASAALIILWASDAAKANPWLDAAYDPVVPKAREGVARAVGEATLPGSEPVYPAIGRLTGWAAGQGISRAYRGNPFGREAALTSLEAVQEVQARALREFYEAFDVDRGTYCPNGAPVGMVTYCKMMNEIDAREKEWWRKHELQKAADEAKREENRRAIATRAANGVIPNFGNESRPTVSPLSPLVAGSPSPLPEVRHVAPPPRRPVQQPDDWRATLRAERAAIEKQDNIDAAADRRSEAAERAAADERRRKARLTRELVSIQVKGQRDLYRALAAPVSSVRGSRPQHACDRVGQHGGAVC